MNFALLGDHADALELVRTLASGDHHELLLYCGPPAGLELLQSAGISPRPVTDVEEVLANPGIDAVIVASGPTLRAAHLRRALQSESHVLCVHPAGDSPDMAYEAAMIQADTGRVLLPLLPLSSHPGIARFSELTRAWLRTPASTEPGHEAPALLKIEVWSTAEVLLDANREGDEPGLPGWDVLRFLGGEISEVFLLSTTPELRPGQPCLLTGRFQDGGLFQATYMPNQGESRARIQLTAAPGRAALEFPEGWNGRSELIDSRQPEAPRQTWASYPRWSGLIDRFEEAVDEFTLKKPKPGQSTSENLTKNPSRLGWLDELRALELDDAARRSAERGRSSTLEFQDSTEEASFKGTMTLVGCSMIWLSLVVLIMSAWIPWLAWLILPVFGIFLLLQVLRWAIPVSKKETGG